MRKVIYLALLILSCVGVAQAQQQAKWTIFVYMNADNNLELYAGIDYAEMKAAMAAAGAQFDNVNVVLLLDRTGAVSLQDYGLQQWAGAVTWKLGDEPSNFSSVASPRNMGNGATLTKFLKDGLKAHPANRYALVMWCHGSGWRPLRITSPVQAAAIEARRTEMRSAVRRGGAAARAVAASDVPPPEVYVPNGVDTDLFKAASADHGDFLYNAEIAKAVEKAMGPGKKLDLLAFDSCLMGMLEAVYAFRGVADTYVGSEELVPSHGFPYQEWLTAVASAPESNGAEAAAKLVGSFKAVYEAATHRTATLAAVDVSKVGSVAEATSTFADALRKSLTTHSDAVIAARQKAEVFDPHLCRVVVNVGEVCQGGKFQHVDLWQFAKLAAENVPVDDVKTSAEALQRAIDAAVRERRWAGADRVVGGPFGSKGLAIYFPADAKTFENDPWNDHSYDKPVTNRFLPHPVAFVSEQRWADFLHAYLERTP